MKRHYECCICGDDFFGWGNNPWPIVKDEISRCCDDCNVLVVNRRIRDWARVQTTAKDPSPHQQ